MISTDHPIFLPIGRFLDNLDLGHWKKVRTQVEEKFGSDKADELFPDMAYRLPHHTLFPHDCFHLENLGGEIGNPALHNKRITLGAFPWNFKCGEAAFCRAVPFV
ncbi:MAG: hypothetical protein OEY93_06375 [Anaerolineae bacterium]|nr:hypothetical protein [Anaerolineae bacterium]